MRSLSQGVTGEVYNIGTEKERTVKDVALDIAKAFNLPASKVVHVKVRASYKEQDGCCKHHLGSTARLSKLLCWLLELTLFCQGLQATQPCWHASRAWLPRLVELLAP